MMLLAVLVSLLCLSTYSEGTVIFQDPAGSITLTCSADECPGKIDEYKFLYLHHELQEQEEVLFWNTDYPRVSARPKYQHRIQTDISNMTFTINNLTVNDSGIYRCEYKKSATIGMNCSIYAVFVTEKTPCPTTAPTAVEIRPPLMLYVIFVCVISVLAIWISFLLIIPRVKRCCIRRRERRTETRTNENVYEIMNKNPLDPIAAMLESA